MAEVLLGMSGGQFKVLLKFVEAHGSALLKDNEELLPVFQTIPVIRVVDGLYRANANRLTLSARSLALMQVLDDDQIMDAVARHSADEVMAFVPEEKKPFMKRVNGLLGIVERDPTQITDELCRDLLHIDKDVLCCLMSVILFSEGSRGFLALSSFVLFVFGLLSVCVRVCTSLVSIDRACASVCACVYVLVQFNRMARKEFFKPTDVAKQERRDNVNQLLAHLAGNGLRRLRDHNAEHLLAHFSQIFNHPPLISSCTERLKA